MTAKRSRQPLGEPTTRPENNANTDHSRSTSTQIVHWGSHAERFVRRHTSAVLVAVFARSLYLQAESDFLCIGDTRIGNGPLNATVDFVDWARIAKRLPPLGRKVAINAATVEIGSAVLGTARASTWRPPGWPRIVRIERLAEALRNLERCTYKKAPVEGLVRIVWRPIGEPATALDRIARPRVNRLRKWVSARLSQSLSGPPPIELLGLGPGLTPSGDDLLCGALVVLRAIGAADASGDLHAAIAAVAPSATSPLSGAFLRAAAEGCGSAGLHNIIISLIKNEPIESDIDVLARIGHTSGWDALAGAAIVLQAFSTCGRDAAPSSSTKLPSS